MKEPGVIGEGEWECHFKELLHFHLGLVLLPHVLILDMVPFVHSLR